MKLKKVDILSSVIGFNYNVEFWFIRENMSIMRGSQLSICR